MLKFLESNLETQTLYYRTRTKFQLYVLNTLKLRYLTKIHFDHIVLECHNYILFNYVLINYILDAC